MFLHYSTLPFRSPVNCNWWTNLSSGWDDKFCCCIATTTQISLSPNWDWARFSLKQGIKRTCQPTIQQDTVPPASIPLILRLFRGNLCLHSANKQWGRSGLQRCDSDWATSCYSFVTAKESKGFSFSCYIWQCCVNQRWITVQKSVFNP